MTVMIHFDLTGKQNFSLLETKGGTRATLRRNELKCKQQKKKLLLKGKVNRKAKNGRIL